MGQVWDEPRTGFDFSGERFGHLGRQAEDDSTALTSEVQMRWTVGCVIRGGAGLDMRVPHETDLLEDFEHAVNRGQTHVLAAVRDECVDLFGGGVPQGDHGSQNSLPLGCVSKPMLTQDCLRRHTHAGRRRAERWLLIAWPIAAMS